VEEAGIWKPASGAYNYALEQCGVNPVDAMLVAVHPWDVDGSVRAGLGAAWVNRSGGLYPAYFRSPDLVVESITALADRLR
jgi:2-haloacid dehalogenase